jgi:3-oxoacyl-[acyl-carrier protein] reductase
MDLKGQSVLITGGSRGIGAGIAKRLAELGARVAITYSSSKESAETVLKALPGEGHLLLQLNVTDENSVSQCVAETLKSFDKLDGLVNNHSNQFKMQLSVHQSRYEKHDEGPQRLCGEYHLGYWT